MSALISFSIKNASGKYDNYTMSINDDVDKYGNNCAVTVSQSKAQREAKEKKTYVGNGRVVYVNDSGVKVAPYVEREGKPQSSSNAPQSSSNDFDNDSIPF
tara:strand:- start:133 stop:435 length:303 start_codon:yes stop_codon:yes gene_type:complete